MCTFKKLSLVITLVSFIFNPSLIAAPEELFTAVEGYDLSVPLASEDTNLARLPFQNWAVTVHPVERIELSSPQPDTVTDPLPISPDRYKKLHQDAGLAVKTFLEQNSAEKITEKLRPLAQLGTISPDQLSGSVHVHFLEDDDEKLIYLVEFGQRIDTQQPIWIEMKLLKTPDAAKFEQGFELQKKLNVAQPKVAPQIGDVIRSTDFIAYFEEYISGKTLSSLMKKEKFDQATLQETIQTIMEIYKAVGYVASDPRPKNMILLKKGNENGQVMIVDLDQKNIVHPHHILKKLNDYYGEDITTGFIKKKRTYSKEVIFQEIISTLGKKDGWRFLKRASKNLNEKAAEIQAQPSPSEDDKRLIDLAQALEHFFESYLKNLPSAAS